jgi:hypothetical protein
MSLLLAAGIVGALFAVAAIGYGSGGAVTLGP